MTDTNAVNLIQAVDLSNILDKTQDQKATQLPKPSGWKILCAIPEKEREYESGIVKSDETIRNEELLTTVLFVVDLGPDCYTDKTRYSSGPWCKVGDFILVRPNAGSRMVIHGREFRMINEDSVEGVVEDPRGIYRP
jgi:co-chaperonin GroES (HSP10)